MGDVLSDEPLPPEIDATKLNQEIDAAFDPPASMTAGFVVTWRGRLIAERYGNGITARTPLEGWSIDESGGLFPVIDQGDGERLAGYGASERLRERQ